MYNYGMKNEKETYCSLSVRLVGEEATEYKEIKSLIEKRLGLRNLSFKHIVSYCLDFIKKNNREEDIHKIQSQAAIIEELKRQLRDKDEEVQEKGVEIQDLLKNVENLVYELEKHERKEKESFRDNTK